MGVAEVGGEGRLPVGRGRPQPDPAGRGAQVRRQVAEHRLPPGEPDRNRRHLQRDVLAKQRRQSGHVTVLERGREPVEQRPLAGLPHHVPGFLARAEHPVAVRKQLGPDLVRDREFIMSCHAEPPRSIAPAPARRGLSL